MPSSSPIVLVTGASRGIGRSIALHLADRGVGVIGTYHSNEEEAQSATLEIEARGAKAAMLQLDATETGSFGAFADDVQQALAETFEQDALYGLVHNAGFGKRVPFEEMDEEQFDALVGVHFKGPYFLTQTLLPVLADEGRILFVSSGTTRYVIPGYSAYSPLKAAAEALARSLAKELAERKIRVNVAAPGATETDFAGGANRDDPEINERLASLTALGRVGQADDIGSAVAALLSEDFSWVNGTRIEITGGQNL